MNHVPFLDLAGQYTTIQSEIDQAVINVLHSGRYILGEQLESFEHEFAALLGGVPEAVGVKLRHLAPSTWRCWRPGRRSRQRGYHRAHDLRRDCCGDTLLRRDSGLRRCRSGQLYDECHPA